MTEEPLDVFDDWTGEPFYPAKFLEAPTIELYGPREVPAFDLNDDTIPLEVAADELDEEDFNTNTAFLDYSTNPA